jgi:hypothetical protein
MLVVQADLWDTLEQTRSAESQQKRVPLGIIHDKGT